MAISHGTPLLPVPMFAMISDPSCEGFFLSLGLKKRIVPNTTFLRKGQPVTRDLIAKRIRWSFIIWLAGMVNVTAMLPQLVRIIRTRNIEGLALAMFVLYFLVQVAFSIEGFFRRNRMLMVCMGLSAVVSGTIILLVTYLRHFGG
jgi:uncharacterized protein with PQ loop repeat